MKFPYLFLTLGLLLNQESFSIPTYNTAYGVNKSNDARGKLRWTQMPIRMNLGYASVPDNLRNNILEAIRQSLIAWNTVPNTNVEFEFAGCHTESLDRNDGINTIVFLSSQWPSSATAVAITKAFHVVEPNNLEGSLLDTDILVNAQNFKFGYGEASVYDVQSVLTHELGHVLGLGHEAAPKDLTATMLDSTTAGETVKRSPKENDRTGLYPLYAGGDRKSDILVPDVCMDNFAYRDSTNSNNFSPRGKGCSMGTVQLDQGFGRTSRGSKASRLGFFSGLDFGFVSLLGFGLYLWLRSRKVRSISS